MKLAVVLFVPLLSCSGLQRLENGDLTVSPAIVQAAGKSTNPALDPPLTAILDRRFQNGYTEMVDGRVIQAIRSLARRGTVSAVPELEKLVFDPVEEVQMQALFALEKLHSTSSLPVIARAARTASHLRTREQAYHVVTALTGEKINFMDQDRLQEVLDGRM